MHRSVGRWTMHHFLDFARPHVSKKWSSTTVCFFFFTGLLSTGTFVCWIDSPTMTSAPLIIEDKKSLHRIEQFPLKCSIINNSMTQKCGTNYPVTYKARNLSSTVCPDYFRWIYEDLLPWKSTGISRDVVERAKKYAHFRLVIVGGRVYVEKYKKAFHTRDAFTIWGMLQLLRLYPGTVPDLELMFLCEDKPVILKQDNYHYQGANATSPPLLFQYCGRGDALGLVFPDWTFWGWAEINVRPWERLSADLKEANKRTMWKDRIPYAYWKGNPNVAPSRARLMWCNVSDKYDWNARLYEQDWRREIEERYKHSKLEDQCTHRYKIYVEGRGWSVSEKYILACDSMTLFVEPQYHDFFIRSMVPLQHYWPISARNKCRDIKFAVDWGNNHTDKAQAIGKAGSKFIQKNLKMEYVYDYMFHLLNEYSKLLKFKPTVPKGAVEVCPETMACHQKGIWKKFMVETMVKFPKDTQPCKMPLPYESHVLQAFLERKESISKQVQMWEKQNWQILNKRQ